MKSLILVVISVLLLIISIALHEYMPVQMTVLMKYTAFKDITKVFHKLYKIPIHYLYKLSNKSKQHKKILKEKLFTKDQLKEYNGHENSKGLYLAILGHVYDVKKGNKYYGPGGGYEFFAGE